MPFDTQTILEVDMLFEAIAIMILIASLVVPLAFPARKTKETVLKVDTDTRDSEYAINEHGFLERIKWHDPQHD